jgi:SWI/SNF related-matrix-associated actin-dependent regulator of chromatin subfamily C
MPFQYPDDDDEDDNKELTSLRELYGQMRKEMFDPKLAGIVKPRITTLVAEDADPDDPDSGRSVVCDSCKQDCTDARYQSLKIKNTQVCPDCFLEGRFSSTMSSGDFLRVEGGMEKPSPEEEWTTHEQLLLLEAIEKYDDDWLLISEYVGTRSKEQCVTQFLQSPIQDNILKSLTELTEEERNNSKIPFENAENPVMTMVAFLCGAVNPAVGAVAAQSSLRVLLESKNEKDEDDQDDSDDEGASCFSRKTLEQATSAGLAAAIEQAHALAKHEDAEVHKLIQIVTTTQLKKLDLKIQQYEELEQSLVNEQKELEKQRVMLITSINAMMSRAPHLSNSTTPAPAPASTPAVAAPATPQNAATPPTTNNSS